MYCSELSVRLGKWLIGVSVKDKCDVKEVDYLFVSCYGDA